MWPSVLSTTSYDLDATAGSQAVLNSSKNSRAISRSAGEAATPIISTGSRCECESGSQTRPAFRPAAGRVSRRGSSETNQPTLRLEGLLRGFEQPHHAQARRAVVDGRLVLHHAIEEIPELDLQRFGRIDLRRPDVAGAIADEQVVESLAVGDVDALVVHPDLLVRLQVVPDQHLVLAADERGPDLDRRD